MRKGTAGSPRVRFMSEAGDATRSPLGRPSYGRRPEQCRAAQPPLGWKKRESGAWPGGRESGGIKRWTSRRRAREDGVDRLRRSPRHRPPPQAVGGFWGGATLGAPMAVRLRTARRRGYTPHGIAAAREPSNAPSDKGTRSPRSEACRGNGCISGMIVKKCKKNVFFYNFICIYQIFFVPL